MSTESAPEEETEKLNIPEIETDRFATAKQRRGQTFFSHAVFVSYNNTCCITGNPIPSLLTASHIVPWKDSKTDRLNPRNGLCLAKTQDAAFDKGLITLDENLKVVISKNIRDHMNHDTIRENFQRYEGQAITLPHRFIPDLKFVEYHRERIFVA
jgi:predicted restriction endonuclease